MDDVIRLGSHYDVDSDGYVTWEEFHEISFGNSYKGTLQKRRLCTMTI